MTDRQTSPHLETISDVVIRKKYFEIREASCINWGIESEAIKYEGWSTHSHNHAISLQNHGAGHDTIPYIKAMDIPFHLIYGSLICVKRLQRDRQNKKGNLQTPGRHQNMITKYLSVGLWS